MEGERGDVSCSTLFRSLYNSYLTYSTLKPIMHLIYTKESFHFSGSRQGADRYVLVKKLMNWLEAQKYCRSHHTDLVSIRNSTENQAVTEASVGHRVWIGLFRDRWHWSDGRYSSLRHWDQHAAVGIFPQSCAVMTSHISGRWSQRSCDELHPFLCTCKQLLRVLELC